MTTKSTAHRRWTLSGDANHAYVTDETGRILSAHDTLDDAQLVHGALTFLISLNGSGVWGVNEDGSVWVEGGAWTCSEHYGTADSPLATFAANLLHPAQAVISDDR